MAVRESNGIKAIIFDCFGVLYVGSLQMLYDITPKEHWQQLHDLNIGSDYGYIGADEYVENLAAISGLSKEKIIEEREKVHTRNTAVIKCLRELHESYKIALLSNVGPELIEHLFTEEERSELFDTIVLSSKEGIVKPHPRIFEVAAERLGVEPGECVMIDDLEKNIDGADAAGMRGIVFTDLDALKRDLSKMGVAI